MPIHKTEAIVLNKYDFRETSLIVNFYTRNFGKISGILKGIRKEPAKFASTLDLFSHNDIIFYKSANSGLHLVSQADLIDNFINIRNNLHKLGICNAMLELLNSIMPQEDINEDVFNLALFCLKQIGGINDADKIMLIFKIKMLALSGFKPHFDSCVSCGNKISGYSKFSVSLGGLLCPNCSNKDTKAYSIYKGTVASILYVERNSCLDNLKLGINPQIKKELDFVINSFLNFHLNKKLKSESIVKKIV